MASNALPESRDRLFALCLVLCDGLHQFEARIGVKQTTEAVLRAVYHSALAADIAHGEALTARKDAYATLATASEAARTFLSNARHRLAKFFGDSYTLEWGAAGWPTGTVAIPRAHEDRLAQVAALQSYFTHHPAHESTDMDATAAIAGYVLQALNAARAQVAAAMASCTDAMRARDEAEATLRKRVTALVAELKVLLREDDSRWQSLGLNRPADDSTPEAPATTTVTAGPTGTLLVDWDNTPRADHYRVWLMVEGTDTEFKALQSPSDNNATLTGLPHGAAVKLRVTAVNRAGESPPGPEMVVRVT